MEQTLEEVHQSLAHVMGQMALVLVSHRGLRRSLITRWVTTLREAADKLERST